LDREFPAKPLVGAAYENMCKYAGPLDPNYRTVLDTIKGFMQFSPTQELWKIIGASDALSPDKEKEQVQTLEKLLARGADPNLRNYSQKSALHLAVQNRKKLAVSVLVGEGAADLSLPDGDKNTALQIAKSMLKDKNNREALEDSMDIFLILLQSGATENEKPPEETEDIIPLVGNYIEGSRHASKGATPHCHYGQSTLLLDQDCEEACNKFNLAITSFCPSEDNPTRRFIHKEHTVYTALYGNTTEATVPPGDLPPFNPNKFISGLDLDPVVEPITPAFTWYHLPANNVRRSSKNTTGYID
jgi:hypothetical protein